MWWALVITAAVAPVDTLVITRTAGPDTPEGPSRTDVARAAEDAARQFSDLQVRARSTVSAPDSALRACGPKVECLSDRLRGTGIARVVFAIVNRATTPPLVTAEVFDTEASTVRASKYAEGEDLLAVLRTLVQEGLSTAGHTLGADVFFDVTPRHATIRLGASAATDAARGVAVGSHVLRIDADGYEPYEAQLDLTAGARREVTVALEKTPPIFARWWFWAGVGVVAAGATAGVLVATGTFERSELCYGGEGVCR
ncbi:MAG: PEGA domain-containing protein [Deltaproteobacteria bacterium]